MTEINECPDCGCDRTQGKTRNCSGCVEDWPARSAARDDQQVVRDYIVSLAPHRTSDVEEAVALTALGNLTPKRDDAPAKLAAVEALHYRTTYKLENGVDPVDVVDGCVICGPNWPCNTRRVIA